MLSPAECRHRRGCAFGRWLFRSCFRVQKFRRIVAQGFRVRMLEVGSVASSSRHWCCPRAKYHWLHAKGRGGTRGTVHAVSLQFAAEIFYLSRWRSHQTALLPAMRGSGGSCNDTAYTAPFSACCSGPRQTIHCLSQVARVRTAFGSTPLLRQVCSPSLIALRIFLLSSEAAQTLVRSTTFVLCNQHLCSSNCSSRVAHLEELISRWPVRRLAQLPSVFQYTYSL